tara:strand:- start:93 stop:389 length:297 start_codon:yes stop_codon:yes gene_type:complete
MINQIKMVLSEIQVEQRGDHWHVVNGSGVIGAMYNFYEGAKKMSNSLARNPFPFMMQRNQFKTKAEAEEQSEKTKDHVRAVLDMPIKQRIGSSAYWRK